MTKKVEFIELLTEKYGIKADDISDTTPIADIIGSDKNLGAHLKDKFGTQPTVKEEEGFDTFEDVLTWLDN